MVALLVAEADAAEPEGLAAAEVATLAGMLTSTPAALQRPLTAGSSSVGGVLVSKGICVVVDGTLLSRAMRSRATQR